MTEKRETGWHEMGSTMYRGPRREHVPCQSEVTAHLAVPDPAGAVLRCGLLDGHIGPHIFHIEWSDPLRCQRPKGHDGPHRLGGGWLGEPCDEPLADLAAPDGHIQPAPHGAGHEENTK